MHKQFPFPRARATMRSEAGKIRKWRRESEKQDEDQDKPKLEGFVLRCRGGFD